MKVQPVGNNSFGAIKRTITPQMYKNVEFLLDKMMEGSTYRTNGDYFVANIIKELSANEDKIQFKDGRIYVSNKAKGQNLGEKLFLTLGKTELLINNKTGEIVDSCKPIFKTWNSIMDELGKSLEFFKENFDNSELVTQKTFPISGFTMSGWEKFRKWTEV